MMWMPTLPVSNLRLIPPLPTTTTTTAAAPSRLIEFAGCTTTPDKQLHMVGHLLELAYNIPNVSRSPGFETALEILGGSTD